MPCVALPVRRHTEKIQRCKGAGKAFGDELPLAVKHVGLFQLLPADCRQNIGKIAFIPFRYNIVFPACVFVGVAVPNRAVNTVRPHQFNPLGGFGIAETDHAALPCGDGFCRIKRENARIAESTAVASCCF